MLRSYLLIAFALAVVKVTRLAIGGSPNTRAKTFAAPPTLGRDRNPKPSNRLAR